ncbi:hypothetical protein P7C70_g1505, partial [Phenoliferia sp. Uapishka_3]
MSSLAPALPAELIQLILEFAVEEYRQRNPRYSYPTLRKVARLSKAWAGPAKELLWRKVWLHTARQANSFLASTGQGKYTTDQISINVLNWKSPQIDKLLGSLVGLKWLELGRNMSNTHKVFDNQIDATNSDFLYLPNMKSEAASNKWERRRTKALSTGLTALTIHSSVVPTSNQFRMMPLHFRLQHLVITGSCIAETLSMALLLASSDSLISLDLFVDNRDFYVRNLTPLPNLESLKFNSNGLSFAFKTIPLLPRLQHLGLEDIGRYQVTRILQTVQHPLRSLELSDSSDVSRSNRSWESILRPAAFISKCATWTQGCRTF